MNTSIEELAEKINYCIENHIDLSKVSLRLKINGVEGEISIPNPEIDFIWIRDKPGKKPKYSGLELVFSSKRGE